MSTININVQYRPVKIGWCIRENNLNDYKAALRLSHTLWGGRYNPLIPIGNFKSASELIDFFKVDVLFPINNSRQIAKFISKFPHLPWPHHFDKDLFIKWINEREPVFLDIFQAALRLREDLNKENALSKIRLNLIDWKKNDPLSNIFNAMFGCLPSARELNTYFDYNTLLTEMFEIDSTSLAPTEPVDSALIQSRTVNWLTRYLLKGKTSTEWNAPGFYFGKVDNFNDLVNFWNLRACGIELIYYDPAFKDRLSKLKEDYTNILRSRPPTTYEPTPSVGIWLQESNQHIFDPKEFDGPITICRLGTGSWNGLNIKTPTWHFKAQTVLGVLSENNSKSLAFQLPTKPTCTDTPETNQCLVATVKTFGDINDAEQTFHTPYIPELNLFYGQNTYQLDKIRAEPNGLGIIIQHRDSSLHLQSINIQKLVQALFKQFGMQIHQSEAGIKTSRIIKQLGGLHNCRILKIRGVRTLIEKHSPNASFTKGNATQIIYDLDPPTKKSHFDKYKRLYLEGSQATPDFVFNYLANKNVFRVGIELTCPNCDLKFWRQIDDVKSKSFCELCGNEFNILAQLKDRAWLYRRSGIFGLDDNQAGGIPVTVTLNQLLSNFHSEKFIYVTAMNIERKGSKKIKCESDFIIITSDHNGKVSIIISECKTRDTISAKDVSNLTKVADALSSKNIDTYILFSKLSDFSDVEIKRCMKAQEKYRDRVILLTDRELEPCFLYEEAKKLFRINQYATNWEGMTTNTKAIFLEKRKIT